MIPLTVRDSLLCPGPITRESSFMNTKTRRSQRPMPSINTLVRAHPELAPIKPKRGFQPTIKTASSYQRPANVTAAERTFAAMLKRGQIRYLYEPFILGLEMRKSGTVRSFQPDFWLPELGIVVEICARAYVKNRKVRLTAKGWPDLAVLVLEDREVKQLARKNLTRWQLIEIFAAKLAQQAERVTREGDDPRGYTRRRPRPAATAQPKATRRRARRPRQRAAA